MSYKRRKGLIDEEIKKLLEELSENESDGGEIDNFSVERDDGIYKLRWGKYYFKKMIIINSLPFTFILNRFSQKRSFFYWVIDLTT